MASEKSRWPCSRTAPFAKMAGRRSSIVSTAVGHSLMATASTHSREASASARSRSGKAGRCGPLLTYRSGVRVTTRASPRRRAACRCRMWPMCRRSKTPWQCTTAWPLARRCATQSASCSSLWILSSVTRATPPRIMQSATRSDETLESTLRPYGCQRAEPRAHGHTTRAERTLQSDGPPVPARGGRLQGHEGVTSANGRESSQRGGPGRLPPGRAGARRRRRLRRESAPG